MDGDDFLANANYDDEYLQKYSYNFINKALFTDGSMSDLSNYLKNIEIIVDTTTNVMPIFRIKYDIIPEIKHAIQMDSEGIVFTLEAKILNVDAASNTTNINFYNNFIDQITLVPLVMDKEPINVKNTFNKDRDTNYQSEKFELLCVPKYCIDINKTIISGNFIDTTVTNAILALGSKLSLPINIVPPDNNNTYNQILLLPNNIITNIKYLETNYGIYNDSLRVFMMKHSLFIGPISNQSTYADGNINLNVRFPISKDDSTTYKIGSYTKMNDNGTDRTIYAQTNINNFFLSDYNELNAELYGNNNHYLRQSIIGGEQYNLYHQDKVNSNGLFNKTKTYRNRMNNSQLLNALRGNINNSTVINFTFSNFNINFDDILKPIIVNLDNSNYNGIYNHQYYATRIVTRYDIDPSTATTQSGIISMRSCSTINHRNKRI